MESDFFANVWDVIEATPEAVAEMKRRSAIMMALQEHITSAGMTETQAAKMLGVAASKVSDLVHGKFSQFGLDELVRMALAAGLTVSHEVLMPFDAAEWLTSDEAISAFLADAEEAGDTDFIAHAREVTELAKQEALASWATYQETGRHLTGQEVRTWLNTWGTENESTVPECHK